MVVVPVSMPDTTPVVKPTLATVVVLLVQVPVAEGSVSGIPDPAQTAVGPMIGAGNGFMVIVALPDIGPEQPVVVLVATTVYVPAAVYMPKLSALPVPGKLSNGLPLSINW
jgi:hypothetical protein